METIINDKQPSLDYEAPELQELTIFSCVIGAQDSGKDVNEGEELDD